MEERILEAVEYITISLDDIKDYGDFIKYKPELMKAIEDIKNIVQKQKQNKKQMTENETIENGEAERSKISSILGLQFDYDPLINEEDAKFFSEYDEKNKGKKIKNVNINNKKNLLNNPETILNCTESLRNKDQLINKEKKINIYFEEKKQKEKIDLITDIVIKINNKDYLYKILTKLFGDDLSDKLLTNQVSDEFLESIQNAIFEIEKINEKYKKINNINEKIDKLYKEKLGIPKNKIRNEEKKEINVNYKYSDEQKNFFYRPKMNKSNCYHKFKYSEPYQEFNFKKSLRNQTPKSFYKVKTRDSSINQSKINYSKNKRSNSNSKLIETPKGIMQNKRPFISATCTYGKYFDEPLQNGGESKLS